MNGLEKELSYEFKDKKLLELALTHPSAIAHEHGYEFERLEFLGDRVLGLIIATWLYEEFPSEKEGDLAKRFASLVRKEMLVEVANALHLAQYLIIKRERSSSQEKRMETLLADGCEALIAALYIDGGINAAANFIHGFWKEYIRDAKEPPRDPKSILQEWVQSKGKSHPLYEVWESSGPAHSPFFIVEVIVEGLEPVKGQGSSKRHAEKDAAQNMLDKISPHD